MIIYSNWQMLWNEEQMLMKSIKNASREMVHLALFDCMYTQSGKKVMRLKYSKKTVMCRAVYLLIISLVIWSQVTGLSRSHLSVFLAACHETVLMLHVFILLQSHSFLAMLYVVYNRLREIKFL